MTPVRLTLAALLAPIGPLAAQFPADPPPPAPISAWATPPVREALLPNGLRLVVIEQPRQPALSLVLAVPAGTAFDPAGKEGTADLLAGLIVRGAGARSAAEIARTVESIGGSLSASADPDRIILQADVVSAHAPLAFELLADAALRPGIDPEEVDRLRAHNAVALEAELDDPTALATRVLLLGAYQRHPYARHPTPQSLAAIGRTDLEAFRRARFRPAGSVLVVAGDITLARARALALAAFGKWTGVRPAPLAAPPPVAPARRQIVLIHRPGATGAFVAIGNTTLTGSDTGYYAAAVLNRVLGEGRGNRLVSALGRQRSWSDATSSSLVRTARLGLFQSGAVVPADVADSTVQVMLAEFSRLRTDLVPAAELERARDALTGAAPLGLETMTDLANAVMEARTLGLPATYLSSYRVRLSAVTAASLRAAARRVLRPDQAVIVVVGDGGRLYRALSAVAPTRLFAGDGRPLTPEEVEPRMQALVLAPGRLRARTDSLVIAAQGRTVGLQVMTVARAGDSLVYTERTALGTAISQTSTLVLDTTARMRSLEQTGRIRGQETQISLRYADGRVRGSGQVIGPTGPVRFATDTTVPANVLDDNAIQPLLPALDWALNRQWNIEVFSSGENRVRTLTLTVRDIETVETPAGRFEAYRAELEGSNQRVTFFVTTSDDHRLVKLTIANTPLEFLLLNP